jgi:phosphotriesterase-related protein
VSSVNTIRGPIDSTALGRTLSHEHLTAGAAGMERVPGLFAVDQAVTRSIEALNRVKATGIDSVIDLTPLDLGRNMELFQRVADADTGVHVVAATGVYRWVPAYLMNRDPDDIAAYFVSEITDGIEGTGIRAGIIKIAWDLEYQLVAEGAAAAFSPRTSLERTARAAARAAKATGVPISCHTRAADELGTPLLNLFEEEGLDLRAVTIGHSNDSNDIEYLKLLASRGANVGLDRYGGVRPDDENIRRAQLALDLAKAGYADQVSLGHDGSPNMFFGGPRPADLDCWLMVAEFEVPWLLANGASEADVDAMLRGSVRRTFEAAAELRS